MHFSEISDPCNKAVYCLSHFLRLRSTRIIDNMMLFSPPGAGATRNELISLSPLSSRLDTTHPILSNSNLDLMQKIIPHGIIIGSRMLLDDVEHVIHCRFVELAFLVTCVIWIVVSASKQKTLVRSRAILDFLLSVCVCEKMTHLEGVLGGGKRGWGK